MNIQTASSRQFGIMHRRPSPSKPDPSVMDIREQLLNLQHLFSSPGPD